jgi:hypothetical protein
VFLDAIRLRLRSLRDQAAALDQLLSAGPELDLSAVDEARALLAADRIVRRFEDLADRIGAAVAHSPTVAAPPRPSAGVQCEPTVGPA